MLYEKERQAIIDICLDMVRDRLTLGTSGNVSVRIGDHVCITPSGFDYDKLTPADITVIDLDGNLVEGNPKPSSEVPMHLLVYHETDAKAVIHTHPRYGTVVGTLVDETPMIHYMLAPCGGAVRVAKYARFGSDELAENVRTAMVGRSAVLLENHGATCWGTSLADAYNKCAYLEWVCEVWVKAKALGDPHLLSAEQFDEVVDEISRSGYGRTPVAAQA